MDEFALELSLPLNLAAMPPTTRLKSVSTLQAAFEALSLTLTCPVAWRNRFIGAAFVMRATLPEARAWFSVLVSENELGRISVVAMAECIDLQHECPWT